VPSVINEIRRDDDLVCDVCIIVNKDELMNKNEYVDIIIILTVVTE